jgi:hypothetical protein
VLLVHVLAWHVVSWPGHWLALLHSTQVPFPSQNIPVPHAVFSEDFEMPQMPPMHVLVAHWLS